MQEIVAEEVAKGVILARSHDEVATNIRSYVLAKEGENLLGYCALHLHTARLAEIRSLIVKDGYRGQNIGSMLVIKAIDNARELNVQEEVLVLTYSPLFFLRSGFVEIAKETIPEQKIWADCIKCPHFPVCNEVSLVYKLSKE